MLVMGVPSIAAAASFDCNKATTETELAICADPELSALDELMAEAYFLAKAANANPHCRPSFLMALFAFPCGEKANEFLLADQKRWLIDRNIMQTSDDLFDKMYRRTIELSSGAIGQNFEKVLQLLSSLESLHDEHLGIVDTKRIDFDVYHNRVIIFEDVKYGSSAYLFDTSGKLARVFLNEKITKDACSSQFSLTDRVSNQIKDRLHVSVSCRNYDRHHFSSSFLLTKTCIELIDTSTNGRGWDEKWTASGGSRRCIEHENFDISFPSVVGLASNRIYFENVDGFVDFVANYWANSPVKAVDADFEGCGASAERLAEIKLINLYKLLSTDRGYYDGDDIGSIKAPSSVSFVGYDGLGPTYEGLWRNSYADMISYYEKYKTIFDPLLKFAKILDADNGLATYVSIMLDDYENGRPSRLDEYDECEVFKVLHGDLHRYTYFRKSGFWKRREIDGTTDQTVEILRKLQKILAD